MANFSIDDALALNVSAEVKEYLGTLKDSSLPNAKNKQFTAESKAKLKDVVLAAFAIHQKNKVQADAKAECKKIIDELTKGTKKKQRAIKPSDLLVKMQALKEEITLAARAKAVDNAIAKSGLTKEELIAYLQQ